MRITTFFDAPLSLRPRFVITGLLTLLLIAGWIEPNDGAKAHADAVATCQVSR